jgi:hypothetical protein
VHDVRANRFVKPTIPYEQYNAELKDYLFTIVLKCYYGKHDSLNFRVINSLYFGTIPLIDSEYDIDNLQIPAELKRYIVVSDYQDIEQKVKHYRDNPDEYRDLFYKLVKHFVDEKYFTESYYRHEFKKYFAELYR